MNNKHLLITQQIYMSLGLASNPNKGELNHSWVRGATKMVEKG